MTNTNIQDLLKKINYIEADIEIQKQILFSIPSDQEAEMEKTIGIIAEKKDEINGLRQQIKVLDPGEYERIRVFENAITEFKKIAAESKFQSIINRNVNEECSLALHNDEKIECLIKACDAQGDWTIITLEGKLQQFPESQVAEKPPEPTNT